jgi:hypothetical protein
VLLCMTYVRTTIGTQVSLLKRSYCVLIINSMIYNVSLHTISSKLDAFLISVVLLRLICIEEKISVGCSKNMNLKEAGFRIELHIKKSKREFTPVEGGPVLLIVLFFVLSYYVFCVLGSVF